MAILEVSSLGKSFGSTEVLKDISFSLEKGESLAIIGSSGSGKTTLLRCLNFLETPDSGTISVNGEVIFDGSSLAATGNAELRKKRLHFGLVFQSFNLFPQYTAFQNVTLAGELLAKERPDYKTSKKQILDEIGHALGSVNAKAGVKKLQEIFEKLEFDIPEATEEQYEELKTSVNPVRLKNHPVALDEETIDRLYHEILR